MRYWSICSVDTAAAGAAAWYAENVFPSLTADPRVARAWVVETVYHHEETGPSMPAVWAVYESFDVDDVEDVIHPDAGSWSSAPMPVSGARSVTREVLANLWFPSERGQWWCSIRIDPRNEDVRFRWEELERWYTFRHIGETARAQGFQEAWRLGEEEPETSDPVHHAHYRWAIYEQTRPEDMMHHVNKEPLQDIWHEFVDESTFGRTYHKVVARV